MPSKRGLRRAWPFLRDFACAMALFTVLFSVLVADKTYMFDFPVWSLFAIADPTQAVPAVRGWGEIGNGVSQYMAWAPAGASVAALLFIALVFSSIVAFNLAILRHLRRVHASPRRSPRRES